mgnify:CR=1 FL=1
MVKILKIGVTGSAGSGKSMVLKAFKALGLVTLDCDEIARQVTRPGQKAHKRIVELFGPDAVLADGTLDRAGLRNLMVADPELRKGLEAILHPVILEELFFQIRHAQYRRELACAAEVPLLFELGLEDRFDAVVTVAAQESDLARRVAQRDKVSRAEARGILGLQMAQDKKKQLADHVVENRGSLSRLEERVFQIYQALKKEFLTKNR